MMIRTLGLWALVALSLSCAPSIEAGAEGPTAFVTPIARSADAKPSVVREGRLRFEPALRTLAVGDRLRFQLFDGREREVRLAKHENGVFLGDVTDVAGSSVVLAHVDDAVAGTLLVPGLGLYRVRTRPGGELRLTELDPEKIPPEVLPLTPPVQSSPSLAKPPSAPPPEGDDFGEATTAPGSTPPALADANTVVDIAMFYTAAAATANGGASGVTAVINAAVATSNAAYANSGVALTLRVVNVAQTTYTESNALATDLPRFAGTSDGYMDEVHATRNAVKADIMSLVVNNGADAAGIGYLWTPSAGAGFASYAFNVVIDDYADSNITLAHEVGHNMGCGHANGDGGSGAWSYSYGWKFSVSGTAYRTVMAYAPGIRIPYFSNPNVNYLGVATGTSTANNASTLTNSKATIAALVGGLTLDQQQWQPITTADFDGDGQTDIIWRHAGSGRVIVWYMNGLTRTSTATVWSGDPAWVPVAAADLNADGKPDLVWRNTSTGRVIVWYLNNVTMTSSGVLWSGDAKWVPIAAGDLNADGKPDLIWRYATTGRVITWLMNGAVMASSAQLWNGDAAWVPIATGDFNADNKTDIVWRNSSTGRVIVWYMNGVTMTSTAALWSGDPAWVPRATGAFAGDSTTDIVWRNTGNGRVLVWTMSGATMAAATPIWE